MENILISNIKIDVVRKDIKNIHLAVYPPTGRVRIAAPLRVNKDAIRLFAISKIGWIRRNQRKFEGQERILPREYKQRESHYFMGRRYLLNVIESDKNAVVILRSKKYLELHIRSNTSKAKCHEIMTEWYRAQLKQRTPKIVNEWAKRLKLHGVECRIKQMKTKWGACNIEKKRIWINLELAKKPESCLEYIIVHELLHLYERHHNERFKFLLEKYLPNWKKTKTELNRLPISHSDWSY